MKNSSFTLLVLGLSSLTACGPLVPPSPDAVSSPKAQVSPAQARSAFKIVADIDYLPFAFKIDGCYARALYMSMELAASKIPSSAQYIWGDLRPTASIQWSFHVAPQIKVGEEEPWILDPALNIEPQPLSEWINDTKPSGQYKTEVKAGSAYFDKAGRTDEFNADNLIQNFGEMPTFLSGDIASACVVMDVYIGYENIDPVNKRRKLMQRTSQLVNTLARLNKFEMAAGDSGSVLGISVLCNRAITAGLPAGF